MLDPEKVDIKRPTLRRYDLWRIPRTSDQLPKTTYKYYNDVSKQENSTVKYANYALLAVADVQIVTESQFRLTNSAEVFAAEVQAIKEAVTGAIRGILTSSISTQIRDKHLTA